MDIERILGTDSGKVAFEKTDRNMIKARDEINDLHEEVITTGVDLNTLKKPNKYYNTPNNTIARACTNIPTSSILSFRLECIKCTSDSTEYLAQILIEYDGLGIWFRGLNKGTWSLWKQISATETTDIALLNSWIVYVGDTKVSRNGNIVTIPPLRLSGGVTSQNTVVFNLPAWFRPKSTRHAIAFWDNTKPTFLSITSNGNVSILYGDAPTSSSALTF
ncbi:MAG: pyocin knob domain-containing protein, partial [Bacteroidales bacterium]